MKPKLSVIMPVYNAEEFLRESVDNILNQSFSDFEFLICDDGSTDESFEILSSYDDPRINLYRNRQNLGIVRTCNLLIQKSKGEYFTRHDSDDISLPFRFQKQIDFLNKNPQISVCGTNNIHFGDKNRMMFAPQSDAEIKAYMMINNPFCTSSVMIRRSAKAIYYNEALLVAEDYALWFELSKTSRMANLSEHLLKYRWHDKNISQQKKDTMAETVADIREKILNVTLSYSLLHQESMVMGLILDSKSLSRDELKILENFLIKLLDRNEEVKYYDKKILQYQFFHLWTANCLRIKGEGIIKKLSIYLSSNLFRLHNLLHFISWRNLRSFSNKYFQW